MYRRLATCALMGLSLGCLALLAAEPAKPLVVKDPLGNKTYNIDELRKKLAYESLVDRLAYETKGAQRRVPAPKDYLETEGWRTLVMSEREGIFGDWRMRRVRGESLEKLHSDQVEAFVKRDGFGLTRALTPSPSLWERPVAQAIPYPKLPALPDDASAGVVLPPRDETTYLAMRWPGVDALGNFHSQSRTNFVNPGGFGHIKDREHVAGFQAHQFRHLPHWTPAKPEVKESWAIRRLELVSLLKHETPVVYVDEQLPRMETLRSKDAKTRELNDFEDQALKEVKDGKNVVAEATVNRIRMMGAIRATESCLKCHDGKLGDLLGTFSYELQRDPLLALKK